MTTDTLLISVGGTTAPIVYSIRQNQPQSIIFFVSSNSRGLVSAKILPKLIQDPGEVPDHEFVVTPDGQDLGLSTNALLNDVPAALRRLNVEGANWPQLVDYTGGTKTMSAALVWASSRHPCKMSYIGATDARDRTREGLGTVMDGREYQFLKENPWDKIAWLEVLSAIALFNRGQYANTASLLKHICERVSEDLPSRILSVLAEISEGFYCWDVFDHRNALPLIRKGLRPIQDLSETRQTLIPGLKSFAESAQKAFDCLKTIKPGQNSWPLIHDLLANALRRAELEKKYEDATARCYAAVEKIAQYQLSSKYGIDAGNARLEQLPDELRVEYERRYQIEHVGADGTRQRKIRFGLSAGMDLLAFYRDPIGLRFQERRIMLSAHLEERNRSILGHGVQPMDERKFLDLFDDALYLLKIEESQLTRFPKFE